jgi:hypothetical protein
MSLNLKALGLTLVAAFALSAISASMASAETQPIAHFWCSAYPCHGTGEQVGLVEFEVEGLGTITCEVLKGESEAIEKASTSSTVKTTLEKCHSVDAFGATHFITVTTNGCTSTYTVHAKKTLGGTVETEGTNPIIHYWNGDVHLKCPVGVNGIEIHAYKTTDTNHTTPVCTYTVKPQTIEKIDYKVETTTPTTGRGTATDSPVKLTRTSGSFLTCGPENQTAHYQGVIKSNVLNSNNENINGGIDNVAT